MGSPQTSHWKCGGPHNPRNCDYSSVHTIRANAFGHYDMLDTDQTRYNPAMRLLPIIFIALAGSLIAGEPTPAYPLWDGQESVAEYAKKVNLPPTKTLDLGSSDARILVWID